MHILTNRNWGQGATISDLFVNSAILQKYLQHMSTFYDTGNIYITIVTK